MPRLPQLASEEGGNNESAFFFCLPSSAKWAMAEILVSDLCARRLLAAGDAFVGVDMTTRCVSARLYSDLFSLFCALYFPLAFSFAISMTFPVFGAPDAL